MGIGVELMIVGMLTVFAILLIVIYGSKLLIVLLNKVCPADKVTKPSAGDDFVSVRPVLDAAVREISGGKAHIVRIEKL